MSKILILDKINQHLRNNRMDGMIYMSINMDKEKNKQDLKNGFCVLTLIIKVFVDLIFLINQYMLKLRISMSKNTIPDPGFDRDNSQRSQELIDNAIKLLEELKHKQYLSKSLIEFGVLIIINIILFVLFRKFNKVKFLRKLIPIIIIIEIIIFRNNYIEIKQYM